MLGTAPRILLRSSYSRVHILRPQRLFSLAPPSQRSRSWKNLATRWALAIGGIYYYNTSNIFAEEPVLPPSSPSDDTSLQTLESIGSSRQRNPPKLSSSSQSASVQIESAPDPPLESSSLSETEAEASQQGAFNEETGEINWDCPCLGGMAHGPCGEQFRTAFSCFVFSKEEPKGMDCIESFKGMQDCFRQHPDVYGGELEDEPPSDPTVSASPTAPEVDEPSIYQPTPGAHSSSSQSQDLKPAVDERTLPSSPASPSQTSGTSQHPSSEDSGAITGPAPATQTQDTPGMNEKRKAASSQVAKDSEPQSESDELVPKAWHDAQAPKQAT